MSEPTLIPGKTLNKLELSNVTADMNGNKFTVVVKSQYGSVSSTGILKVGSSPVISKHPVSVIGGLNVKIDFSVTVSGTEPLKYQWRKNGQNISGATQAIFSINSATLNDSGDYDVVVTNDFGTVYSQIANFVAGNKPVITTQPKSSVSLVGSETVSVVATGTDPLTYQWFKDNVAISGATSSSYNITSNGTYKVVVSNQIGSVTSTDCVVDVVIAPRIITQPFGTTTPALLKVVATGNYLTYKWYKNGVEISGETQDSYIANDAGTYKVVVSNAAGSATSNDVTLITVQPPLIIKQPIGGSIPINLSVSATGTLPLKYQWYKDDIIINNTNSTQIDVNDDGAYKVVISNDAGMVTSDIVIVKSIPPSIIVQPLSSGNLATNLFVVATGSTPFNYEWYKDDILINNSNNSSYLTNSAGLYKVKVINSIGFVFSNTVLVANPPIVADDNYTTTVGESKDFTPLSNDSDPDLYPQNAVLTIKSYDLVSSKNNTISLKSDRKTLTYTPKAGFYGTDSFKYTAFDSVLESNQATVNVIVTCNPPIITQKKLNFNQNNDYVIDITNPNADPQNIYFVGGLPDRDGNLVTQPIRIVEGSVSVNGTGLTLVGNTNTTITLKCGKDINVGGNPIPITVTYTIINQCNLTTTATMSGFIDVASKRRFVFDFDYLVLTYAFTDGSDLDTRTRIVTPDVGQNAARTYLGWGQDSSITRNNKELLVWGGDNTGTGEESCIFYTRNLVSEFPNLTSFIIDCRCMWFGSVGEQPVKIKAYLAKGGTVQKSQYSYSVRNPDVVQIIDSFQKVISYKSRDSADSGVRVATLQYDIPTSTGIFDSDDTTTPSV